MRYQVRITQEHNDRDRVFFALETDSLTDAIARWYAEILLNKRTCVWDTETLNVVFVKPLGYVASFLHITESEPVKPTPTYTPPARRKKPSGLKITFER